MLVAILLATGIGFIFEVKAEKEFKILNKAKDERPVKVLRLKNRNDIRPQTYEIPKSDVCVGDVVVLENGDEVPADGNLISDRNLIIDESNFTGEPFTKKEDRIQWHKGRKHLSRELSASGHNRDRSAARRIESQLSARKPRKGKAREYYRKSLRWRLL